MKRDEEWALAKTHELDAKKQKDHENKKLIFSRALRSGMGDSVNMESHLSSAAAFVEEGIQDAYDDACNICLEAFVDSDPSTVTRSKHEFHLQCILECSSIGDSVNMESHLSSVAAFVEGGIQDARDDACSIRLEAFVDSDHSMVTSCKHEFHLQYILECSSTGGSMNMESHLSSAASFIEGGIQDACDDACSICLEAFVDSDPSTVTSSKHEFHLQCILEWCQRSAQCPMFWQDISLKDPTSQERDC